MTDWENALYIAQFLTLRNRDQSSDVAAASSYSKPSYLPSSSAATGGAGESEYSDYSKRVSETLARHGQNSR